MPNRRMALEPLVLVASLWLKTARNNWVPNLAPRSLLPLCASNLSRLFDTSLVARMDGGLRILAHTDERDPTACLGG